MPTDALPKIRIEAVDFPGESMEVEVLGSSVKMIKVVVPMTTVTFCMNRPDSGSLYRGILGGREFSFDPGTIAKKVGARTSKAA